MHGWTGASLSSMQFLLQGRHSPRQAIWQQGKRYVECGTTDGV